MFSVNVVKIRKPQTFSSDLREELLEPGLKTDTEQREIEEWIKLNKYKYIK